MTLSDLIIEANDSGWAVTLRQHPDAKPYWEAHLSRPTSHNAAGIIRETAFAIAPDPYAALDLALSTTETQTHLPTGLPGPNTFAPNLLTLLNLQPARTIPTITRR
jgi:hypothetical protein